MSQCWITRAAIAPQGKLLSIALGLVNVTVLWMPVAVAQPTAFSRGGVQLAQAPVPEACRDAILNAETRISDVPNTALVDIDVVTAPDGHPPDRRALMRFVAGGPGSGVILTSPEFMQTISTAIITGCEIVSVVEFALDESDGIEQFGLIDGEVKRFDCVEAGEPTWGYQRCSQ